MTESRTSHRQLSVRIPYVIFTRLPDTLILRWPAGHQEGCPHACTNPQEFRRRAFGLVYQGASPVAKDLGISESCLRNWIAQADDNGSQGKADSAEKKELA